MRVCGIVCEYNPFHNGHKYQIEKIRESGFEAVVAVMSGNFVQRGEPAILEKHQRAKQALLNGVDMVLELPLPFSLSSAQRFAFGAVNILDSLGLIDSLCFGSETGDIDKLKTIAEADFDESINSFVSNGISYPSAFEKAVEEKFGVSYSEALKGSNNLLGIEYIRALNSLKSSIKPFTVKREGVQHDNVEANGNFSSAQYIRNNILDESIKKYMPENSYRILKTAIDSKLAPASLENCERAVLAVFRKIDKELFSAFPDVSEGLDNRLYSAIHDSTTLDEIYSLTKTKRYTMARIKRLVLCAYLGIDKSFYESAPPYIRVLGLNDTGRQILKDAKDTAKKPVYMLASDFKKSDDLCKKFYDLECRATDLYSLCTPEISSCGNEHTNNPVIILK